MLSHVFILYSLYPFLLAARYNKPIIHSIPEKFTGVSDSILICDAYGGYPEGQIRWFDESSAEWTKSSHMTVHRTPNGLVHLSSELSLLRGSIFSSYTCVVFNASGDKDDETVFEVDPIQKGELSTTPDAFSCLLAHLPPHAIDGPILTEI